MFARMFRGHGRTSWRLLGALVTVLAALGAPAGSASADAFGIQPGGFTAALSTTQAGAHPDLTTSFHLTHQVTDGVEGVSGRLKDAIVDLPGGIIGDTTAVPACPKADLVNGACPAAAQVGLFQVTFMLFGNVIPLPPVPLYNVAPSDGRTAELGAMIFIGPVPMAVRVRDEDDYGLRTTVSNAITTYPVEGTSVTLWGIPADHNGGDGPRRAFLTNPSSCGSLGSAHLRVVAWPVLGQAPIAPGDASTDPFEISGCDQLPAITPKISVKPDTPVAGAPSGYDIDLYLNHNADPDGLAVPPPSKVSITLPEGTAISPGSVDGLTACTDAQLGAGTTSSPSCPDASKIGRVSIDTPLLADPLVGGMYLGEPEAGNQFRLFLLAKGSGITVRLRGTATPDPRTGQITTTFEGLPQIAFSGLHVHMKGGGRAVLVNSMACGAQTSSAAVTPYGGGAIGTATDSFTLSGDGAGNACNSPTLTPTLNAGTANPVAGAFSPFVLQVKRDDGEPDIRSMIVDLPAGLIGKVAGLPLCSTAAAIAGVCDDAARVGSVAVTVGTGSNPITLPGKVYMTEAYGGPFGLAFVVPAKIGPFDFGTVVVRAKVEIDALTGALRVETDDMPAIIAGIPLHYRSIAVNLDREGFMLNPTSCTERQIVATVTGSGGALAAPSTRFQVGDCASLPLAPKLLISLTGAKEHKARRHPGLKFVMTQTPGQSNLRAVAVTLPGDVSLSLGLPEPCSLAQFAARTCPSASRLGGATAWSPLLASKLSGGVYLVAAGPGGGLPRLGVLLDGQVQIALLSKVTVAGRHVTTTFSAPDLPISRFELSLKTKTALESARELCKKQQKARVEMTGASGARFARTVRVPVQGCKRPASRRTNS